VEETWGDWSSSVTPGYMNSFAPGAASPSAWSEFSARGTTKETSSLGLARGPDENSATAAKTAATEPTPTHAHLRPGTRKRLSFTLAEPRVAVDAAAAVRNSWRMGQARGHLGKATTNGAAGARVGRRGRTPRRNRHGKEGVETGVLCRNMFQAT
jgi:hypothetical protein